MEVDQQNPATNQWNTVTRARFVMVSRNPMNTGSAIINPLAIETEEEKALFRKGEGKYIRIVCHCVKHHISLDGSTLL